MPHHPSTTTALVAGLRTALARRPAVARSVVVVIAVVAGARVWSAQHAADSARRVWGDARTVWLVEHDTARGDALGVRAAQYPLALVPPGALDVVPSGARAGRDLATGEVVVEGAVLGDGSAPDGWVVVAVPTDGAPALVDGDPVTLFEPGRALCDGVVVDAAGGATTIVSVALPPSCAADAATALVDRTAVLGRRTVGASGDD